MGWVDSGLGSCREIAFLAAKLPLTPAVSRRGRQFKGILPLGAAISRQDYFLNKFKELSEPGIAGIEGLVGFWLLSEPLITLIYVMGCDFW